MVSSRISVINNEVVKDFQLLYLSGSKRLKPGSLNFGIVTEWHPQEGNDDRIVIEIIPSSKYQGHTLGWGNHKPTIDYVVDSTAVGVLLWDKRKPTEDDTVFAVYKTIKQTWIKMS